MLIEVEERGREREEDGGERYGGKRERDGGERESWLAPSVFPVEKRLHVTRV